MAKLGDLGWPAFALAFRGFNTTNLGRTAELLACPAYAATVRTRLEQAGSVASDVLGRPVELVARVKRQQEASLADYAEAVALVFATEMAQMDLLSEHHGCTTDTAELVFGYSLGELVALACSGRLDGAEALCIPVAMAGDCAALANDVTMGVLFSRELPIDERTVDELCDTITQQGQGVIAVSAVLSPNSMLLLGQGTSIERFKQAMPEAFPTRVHLRLNDSKWPPLHTPIVRQRQIPDRSAVMIQSMSVITAGSQTPVLSLVTGQRVQGDPLTLRPLLRNWVDHRQRLWDAVCGVLTSSVQTVVHVGPAPNVIPATFNRLAENVRQLQARNDLSGLGARALGAIADRPWLSSRLPTSAALLRAPQLKQVILEDWLLENAPS